MTLTEAGLLLALADENVWSHIYRVASNYRDMLPLIFGEWEFYMDNGLRNEIISRLEAAVQGFSLEFQSAWFKIVKIDRPDRDYKVKLENLGKAKSDLVRVLLRNIAPTLTDKVLGLDLFLFVGEGSEQRSFIGKLIKNQKLEKYFDGEFQYWVRNTKEEYDRASSALEWYQSIKKPR